MFQLLLWITTVFVIPWHS